MTDVNVKDNSEEVLEAAKKAFKRGLTAIGLTAERHAKKDPNMPVDTGLARNSITFALSGEKANTDAYTADKGGAKGNYSGTAPNDKQMAVYIGSNVEYFPYIEFGGKNITARHVLQNAATNYSAEYKNIMKESMENA